MHLKQTLNEMKFDSNEIELFKNLSQFDIGGLYYDFHNDFDCTKIELENNNLRLLFKGISQEEDGNIISLKFEHVRFKKILLATFIEYKNLTLDNLHRGRFEQDDKLLEVNSKGKSYFYLDFYQDLQMEFWCTSIVIEKEEK